MRDCGDSQHDSSYEVVVRLVVEVSGESWVKLYLIPDSTSESYDIGCSHFRTGWEHPDVMSRASDGGANLPGSYPVHFKCPNRNLHKPVRSCRVQSGNFQVSSGPRAPGSSPGLSNHISCARDSGTVTENCYTIVPELSGHSRGIVFWEGPVERFVGLRFHHALRLPLMTNFWHYV